MKPWKAFILRIFENRNIYISRKYHPNDGTITTRIFRELAMQAGGILHIGAHEGQETNFYQEIGVPVIWFEALPDKFNILSRNISHNSNQSAICVLLGDVEQTGVKFNISNNDGASSSIFSPKESANLSFSMTNEILLDMKRLDTVISVDQVKLYRHWVIDVQGAELKVLFGSGELLKYCNSLIIEAKRVSNYENGANWDSLHAFLQSKGFVPLWQIGEHDEDNAFFLRVRERIS